MPITTYDPAKKLPKARYFLAKPTKEIIGVLKHAYNDSLAVRLKEMDTLQLSVPFFYDDSETHQPISNPNVSKIKEHYLIRVDFNDETQWFKINSLSKSSSDSGDEFRIGALSLESELKGKKLINYSVTSKNCQQVLTEVLADTLWSVGTIAPEFNLMFRDFDISIQSAIEFIYGEFSETFKCLPLFDTENRTISIVKESVYGSDLGFRIKFQNYMTQVNKESQTDDLVTRLYPVGNDELTIQSVNETGQTYLDDFSYFIENGYIEDPLLTSLNDYNSMIETKKPVEQTAETGTTTTTIKLTNHGLSVGDYVVNRTVGRETREVLTVPDVNTITVSAITGQAEGDTILKYNSSTFGKLLFELEDLQSTLATKENELTDLETEKVIILDTLAIQYAAQTIDSYSNTITNTSVTRTLSNISSGDKYVALARISTATGTTAKVNGVTKTFTANTWSVLSKITGATSHSILVTTTQTNVSVKTMIVKLTESEYTTSGNESAIIEKYSEDNKQMQIDSKQSEVDSVESSITSKQGEINSFISSVSYENNFTVDELNELKLYIYADEYRDDSIVDPKDLYDIGVTELARLNSPTILYKTSLVDFLSSITEQKNWKKLNLGDTCTIIHDRIGINSKVKITEIEYDFENIGINLTIANDKKVLTKEETVIKYIYDSIHTTRKMAQKKPNWDITKNNFNTRNDRISVIPATPTIANDLTAIEHRVNNNGSVDIYFSWSYDGSGDAYDIDGFYVYTYSSSNDSIYTFGSSLSRQDFKIVKPTERMYAIYGVPADKYYTFGIQAYRAVDTDVSSDGVLKSSIVQPILFAENPYRPEANISLNGISVDAIAKTSGTLIVADGTTSFNPNRADYVVPVSSTQAQNTINEAILSLPLATGGEIVLLDGTYIIDGSINLPSNVTITGQGESTIIKLKNGYNSSLDIFQNIGNENITIRSLKIDGNKSNNSGEQSGIHFTGAISGTVTNITIVQFSKSNIILEGSTGLKVNSNSLSGANLYGILLYNSDNCSISNNYFEDNQTDCISLDHSTSCTINGNIVNSQTNLSPVSSGIFLSNSTNNSIGNNAVSNAGGSGIKVWASSDNNTISGNTSKDNSGHGIEIEGSSNNNIIGNTLQLNGYSGISLSTCLHTNVSSNTCSENNQKTTGPDFSNIRLLSSSFNNIQNNICRRGNLTYKPIYGIEIVDYSCVSNIVSNNDWSNGGSLGNFSDSGTETNAGLNSEGNRDYVSTGTAQNGSMNWIILKSTSSDTPDIYNGFYIFIISGTGSGQSDIITDYDGSSKQATVNNPWFTPPDNTSVYEIR